MKKILFILFLFVYNVGFSQKGFYFGYENGGVFDRYYYVNSKGYTLFQTSLGGSVGGYVGYKYNNFNIDAGFFVYSPTIPYVKYDYDTGKPYKTSAGGEGETNFVLPVSIGKEFLLATGKVFLEPNLALVTIFLSDYTSEQPSEGWGENVTFEGNVNNSDSPDSTVVYGYFSDRINFGLITSLSAGYRIKNKIDVYVRGGYITNFSPLYYETITHYSSKEIVEATRVRNNSFLLQVGIKFHFHLHKDE